VLNPFHDFDAVIVESLKLSFVPVMNVVCYK